MTAAALRPNGALTLDEWARARFDQIPHANTLRKWAREKQIKPEPVLVGRSYFVAPDAQYVGKSK